MDPPGARTAERRTTGNALPRVAASAGMGALAGGVSGLLWGGVGGRIAMRVAFVTSSDAVRGLTSDDGFEIGRFSAGTVFLLVVTTVLGLIAGTFYGIVRLVLDGPTWLLAIGVGAATGAAFGASIVHTEGVDFRFLEPLWLLVAMFVLLPFAWGFSVVVLTERFVRSETFFPAGPVSHRRGLLGSAGNAVAWAALCALVVAGCIDLARDVAALS